MKPSLSVSLWSFWENMKVTVKTKDMVNKSYVTDTSQHTGKTRNAYTERKKKLEKKRLHIFTYLYLWWHFKKKKKRNLYRGIIRSWTKAEQHQLHKLGPGKSAEELLHSKQKNSIHRIHIWQKKNLVLTTVLNMYASNIRSIDIDHASLWAEAQRVNKCYSCIRQRNV